MNCHICDCETDFTCDQCEEPVCEDCCVPMTIHNQIDYPLCTVCHGGNEARRAEYYRREEQLEDELKLKKVKKNAMARDKYHSPENVAKRSEQKRLRKEFLKKQMEETARVIADIFGGMFR